jgi:flagellin
MSGLFINHNLMAATVARNLQSSYGSLSTSTERLSSGLRINSAADDAAGLAFREIMRAEISSLNQGVRNANDAISMIQTADGALGVIDEKLIRMKELAMQASTGTYSSDQRLIIDSEYQAMASEITRIANSTDFNGIHLLNGNLSGENSAHNGTASPAPAR